MTLSLDILTPDGPLVHESIAALRAVDETGAFGVIPGHEDLLTVLTPSVVTYRDGRERERFVAVDGGVLLLEDGKITIVTRDAVAAYDLDAVEAATVAMLQARKSEEQTASVAFSRLVGSLLRSLQAVKGS